MKDAQSGIVSTVSKTFGALGTQLDPLRLIAAMVLIVYMPALVVIALAVVLTSPGPPLVSRVYRRKDGGTVDLWEFRTECWQRWQPTRVGAYLRRSNAHRLPALVNVLRGDIRPGERVKPASDWHLD